MTANLVKNMTGSDLLDMYYFLTEDDDFGGDEFEESFYIFQKYSSYLYARPWRAILIQDSSSRKNFLKIRTMAESSFKNLQPNYYHRKSVFTDFSSQAQR